MERQNYIYQLTKYGESSPTRNTNIIIGEKVANMISYNQALLNRGLQIQSEKYYVFINDKGKIFECGTPEDAVDAALDNSIFDYNKVEIGDYVDFGQYGRFYVCGENIDGTKFLITRDPLRRAERTKEAFYIEKCSAENIIEKYSAVEE